MRRAKPEIFGRYALAMATAAPEPYECPLCDAPVRLYEWPVHVRACMLIEASDGANHELPALQTSPLATAQTPVPPSLPWRG